MAVYFMFSSTIRDMGVNFETFHDVSVTVPEGERNHNFNEMRDISLVVNLGEPDTVIAIETDEQAACTLTDGLILLNRINENPTLISLRLSSKQTISRNGNRRMWYVTFDDIKEIKDVVKWVLKETNLPI